MPAKIRFLEGVHSPCEYNHVYFTEKLNKLVKWQQFEWMNAILVQSKNEKICIQSCLETKCNTSIIK